MSDTLEETASYKINRFFKAMDSDHGRDACTETVEDCSADPLHNTALTASDAGLIHQAETAATAPLIASSTNLGRGDRNQNTDVAMATMTEGVNMSAEEPADARMSSLYEELLAKQISRRSSRNSDAVDAQPRLNGSPADADAVNEPRDGGTRRSFTDLRATSSLNSATETELVQLGTAGRPLSGSSRAVDVKTYAAGDPDESEQRRSAASAAPVSAAGPGSTPQMPAPLITKRTTPLLSRASGGSRVESNGHASAPIVGDRRPGESRATGGHRSSHDFQEALRVDDLAAKVETLSKVLGEREAENVALTTKMEALQEENEKLRQQLSMSAQPSSVFDEDVSQYKQKIELLAAEKDILEQELIDLRSEVKQLKSDNDRTPTAKPLTSFEFDPNNPATLRRKVEDLETQIHDLQEANESTAVLLANYKPGIPHPSPLLAPHLGQIHVEQRAGFENPRGRVTNPETENLRHEIESLRADLLAMRQRSELASAENERLRVAGHTNGMTVPGNSDLKRYERERHSVLDEVQRLRQELREEQSRSSRLTGPQLRSQSYANLSTYENEYRSPYMESHKYMSPDIQRRGRKTSAGAENHQRSSSSTRIVNISSSTELRDKSAAPRKKSSEGVLQVPDEKVDLQSSGSTSSILSDAERELEDMKIIASRSFSRALAKEKSDVSASMHHSCQPPVQSPPAGLRSVSPPPIPTQHNRTNLMKSGYQPDGDRESSFATIGRHPFAPRNAADIQLRDIVKFTRQGGRICKGFVHFVGHLPGRNDVYIGVELEHEDGKHDGTYEGRRYFQCKTNKGVFVAFNKVIMCYGLRPV